MIIAGLRSLFYHLTQWYNMNTTEQALQNDRQDEIEAYSPYCILCGACGEEGCCPPTRCTMKGGDYCDDYLGVLKDAYVELKQIYDFQERLIAVNEELRRINY
jgi:hypothetical protein